MRVMKYIGKTKVVLYYLGFLKDEYDFNFAFQTFNKYNGFCGPIDTYSFYNTYGCFTLLNIVQRGEWGWFVSSKFSTNLNELLKTEINQKTYIYKTYWLYGSVLKELSSI